MNYILLFSSILTFLLTIIILVYFYDSRKDNDLYFIIGIIMISGCILAIFNHGTTSQLYKYIDRIFITITVLFYFYIIDFYYDNPILFIYIIIPIILYILSKSISHFTIRSLFHFMAHMFIMYFHFIMLLNIPTFSYKLYL